MTSVMRPRSAQPPDYANYSDLQQALQQPPSDRGAEIGSTGISGFPEGSLESLGYLPNQTDSIFGQDGSMPLSNAPANGFDVDFELQLVSEAFQGGDAATPAAFGGGGELKFPELPADLLDSAPEYEYSHHTRTNVFDAAQDYAGDEEANRFFGLENIYDPTGPLPAEEDLFGLTNDLGEELDNNFNPPLQQSPTEPQIETFYHQVQDPSAQNLQWGPSPASSFSNSTAPTPVNGSDGMQRYLDETDIRESKRKKESYDYSHTAPPPPAPSIPNGPSPPYGYGRATPGGGVSSGTSTPIAALYSSSPYLNGSLDGPPVPTWSSSEVTRGIWEDPQRGYPAPPPVDYSTGAAGGSMYVSSNSTYPTSGSSSGGRGGSVAGPQRNSSYSSQYYPMTAHSAPRLASGRSSYIPESNPTQYTQPRPNQQQQSNYPNRLPTSISSIASMMPDTFVGPGGVPIPGPGQSQVEMIDAIGTAVDASVQSDGIAQCPYPNCTKTFAKNRTYNLKAHLRAHSQLKPFACTDCSRAFSRRHDLERHARVHSGDKPYVCEICQKGFPRSDALRRHWRVEVECGTKAQELERVKEGQKVKEEPGSEGSPNESSNSNHFDQNRNAFLAQSQFQWNNQESSASSSSTASTNGGGRNTRNSAGNKRKR